MFHKKKDKSQDNLDTYFVSFGIGPEEYGIHISRIQEVIEVEDVIPVPQSPPYMAGVMKMRDTIIPVISLARRFELEESHDEEESADKRAIVVKMDGKPVGLMVDKVNKVIQIKEDIEHAPPTIKGVQSSYIVGIGKLDNHFIIILDLEAIFSPEDLDRIQNAT